jgi:hypothetical protein
MIDYMAWFQNAKAELARIKHETLALQAQIEERDKQAAALTQTMKALAPLIGRPMCKWPPTPKRRRAA